MVKEKGMMGKMNATTKPSIQKSAKVDQVLVENFVSLQKVMTNLAVKFDNLSSQISKLLELFEISAKALAEKGYSEEERKVAKKLDNLLDQNKVIARAVALLHEREKIEESPEIMPEKPRPMQGMQRPAQMPAPQIPAPQYSQGQPPTKSVMEMKEMSQPPQGRFLKRA